MRSCGICRTRYGEIDPATDEVCLECVEEGDVDESVLDTAIVLAEPGLERPGEGLIVAVARMPR